MNHPFFSFIRPFLAYLDSGRFFRQPMSWLYTAFAVGNLLLPIIFFSAAVENRIFNASGKAITAFFLVLIFVAFAGWVGFQLWWDRRTKVEDSSREGDEFVASLSFAHLIQSMGEWLGLTLAIIGTGSTLVISIMGGNLGYAFRNIPILEHTGSFWTVIVWALLGYLIIMAFRYVAEFIRALSAIANHTRLAAAAHRDTPVSEA